MSVASSARLRGRAARLRLSGPSRPPWPPQVLIDLAAGRDPGDVTVTRELLQSAEDHRMAGLLWTWSMKNSLEGDLRSELALRDLRTQAHLRRAWTLLESCVVILRDAGIEVASIKGPITEARWYGRPGERPSSDVDLWLSPRQLDRAGDALALLQPDHPWSGFFGELAARGDVQTVTAMVDGIEVDLHLDLLKTGLPMKQAVEIWDVAEYFELPGGTEVRVLDPTAALLLFVVHINKDRFQRLLGYADVIRIVEAGVSWGRLRRLSEGEGLSAAVALSLQSIGDDLGYAWSPDLTGPTGIRAGLWRFLWRRQIRLRGHEGRRRFRRRQLAIPLLSSRRAMDALWAVTKQVLPPPAVLAAHTSGTSRGVNRVRRKVSRALYRVRP